MLIILQNMVALINTIADFSGTAGPYALAGASSGPSTRFGPMPNLFGGSPMPLPHGPSNRLMGGVKPMEDWEIALRDYKRASDRVEMPPQKVQVEVQVKAPPGFGADTTITGDATASKVRTDNDPGH